MEAKIEQTVMSIIGLLRRITDDRALERSQREDLERAIAKLVYGVRTNDLKRVDKAIEKIVRAFLR